MNITTHVLYINKTTGEHISFPSINAVASHIGTITRSAINQQVKAKGVYESKLAKIFKIDHIKPLIIGRGKSINSQKNLKTWKY